MASQSFMRGGQNEGISARVIFCERTDLLITVERGVWRFNHAVREETRAGYQVIPGTTFATTFGNWQKERS